MILFPAYVLCCMFEVLEPPRPMMEHTWDAAMEALGKGPRVFSAAELKAKGMGARPMLRWGRAYQNPKVSGDKQFRVITHVCASQLDFLDFFFVFPVFPFVREDVFDCCSWRHGDLHNSTPQSWLVPLSTNNTRHSTPSVYDSSCIRLFHDLNGARW